MKFTKAKKSQAKLRLALAGPAGSGKTWGALMIAKGVGGRIAVIDTERGSASLYSDLVDFDSLVLDPPYTPERYIEAMNTAAEASYDILIIDSITHEWSGSGGCLEINDTIANAKFRGNTWAAWNITTPRHRAFTDAILQSPMHIIATMRSKTETVQGDDKKVRKLGMKSEQRDGMEYEFAVVLEIEHERHQAIATKDRTRLFPDPHVISEKTGKRLLAWLESGVPLTPESRPEEPAKASPPTSHPATAPNQKTPAELVVYFVGLMREATTHNKIAAVGDQIKANESLFNPDQMTVLRGTYKASVARITKLAKKAPPQREPGDDDEPIDDEMEQSHQHNPVPA